jgi:hypothetical protein
MNHDSSFKVSGKDLHMKAKSSLIRELAGLIPVKNIFAKRADPKADEYVA